MRFWACAIVIGCLLAITPPAAAGSWWPNFERHYQFTYGDAESGRIDEAHRQWVESLVRNLTAKGGTVDHVAYFAKSSATFAIDGVAVKDAVFVREDDPRQFLILYNYYAFLVDTAAEKVTVLGGGISFHTPKSAAFAVVVVPQGLKISGVPVPHPWFPWWDPFFFHGSVSWR